jgi:hypothetical protein
MRPMRHQRRLYRHAMLACALLLTIVWVLSGFYYASWYRGECDLWIGQGYVQLRRPAPSAQGFSVARYGPGWGYWLPRFSLTPYAAPRRWQCRCLLPLWIPIVLLALPTISAARKRRALRAASVRDDPPCSHCGYSLTGNISGVCPECGTALPSLRI